MSYEVGDILIDRSSTFGHVGMIYDTSSRSNPKIIHAQLGKGFHIQDQQQDNHGTITYLFEGANQYRPPWKKITGKAKAAGQAELKRIADGIVKYATYGKYRAVRLLLGNSTHGTSAAKRLEKYRSRLNANFAGGKFVSTITCSEAVVLCYQLAFSNTHGDFWIDKDAAHVMPANLDAHLKSKGWTVED